jgi:peptidoglycan hydrolase CwlO-like protein
MFGEISSLEGIKAQVKEEIDELQSSVCSGFVEIRRINKRIKWQKEKIVESQNLLKKLEAIR